MAKNTRIKQIQSLLELHGSVDITVLSRKLNVSEMTIRRDINSLVNQGFAVRTHGGAILPKQRYISDIYLDSRFQVHVAEKNAIARTAVAEICPGDSIFIDDSSTATAIAGFLPNNIQLRVTTTSMWAALEFNKFPDIEVITIGGLVSKTTKSAVGAKALDFLQSMYFMKAFIGIPYISVNGIITSKTFDEVAIKQMILQHTKQPILLMDSSKIHPEPLNIQLATIQDFSLIITDSNADTKFVDNCREKDVQIITVPIT